MNKHKIVGPDSLDWREVPINWDATTEDVIRAGTPLDAEGKVANDGTVYGLLMDDVLRGRNKRGRVIISGPVDLEACAKSSGMELSEEAKKALPDVWSQGAGGGSWNDLADKPFGEETTTGPLEITFDGNSSGKVTATGGMPMVKVSNATPTVEELLTGTITAKQTSDGEAVTMPISELYVNSGIEQGIPGVAIMPGMSANNPLVVVAYEKGLSFGPDCSFPEPGVYFFWYEGTYITGVSLPHVNQTTIKTIDPKYLPEGIGGAAIVDLGESNYSKLAQALMLSQAVAIDDFARINKELASAMVNGLAPYLVAVIGDGKIMIPLSLADNLSFSASVDLASGSGVIDFDGIKRATIVLTFTSSDDGVSGCNLQVFLESLS